MKTFLHPFGKSGGFTLIEITVSIAVFALLVILLSQLAGSVSKTISLSRTPIDADSQARMIFDRMASDFSKIVLRNDVDYVFTKPDGNDRMFFYSEAPASFSGAATSSKNPVALVGYQVNSKYQLERLGMGLSWDGSPDESVNPPTPGAMVYLSYPVQNIPASTTATSTPFPQSTITGNWPVTLKADATTNSNYHVIGDQVFRLEICFLLTNGVLSNTPALSQNTTGTTGFNLHDVAAVVVAIGILDTHGRNLVSDPALLVQALPNSVEGTPITETWTIAAYLSAAGVPRGAQIRIYQRCFYLNHE